MMTKLKSKVALITGGTSGIGKATAVKMIAEGATVIITGRYQKTVDETVSELGVNCRGIVSDASKMEDLLSIGNKVKELTDVVDILFTNAGYGKFAPIEMADEKHFDELFNLLVKGTFFTVQQIIPLMKDGSSIILCTSVVTEMGIANFSVYSGAKSAVQSFVKTFASELLVKKIRVNSVSPGYISTNGFQKTGLSQEQIDGAIASITPTLPLKRFGNPEEVANTVCFLASDDSSYTNASEFVVDGGLAVIKN
ncbi:NAD(P)-dependent dehydrogenase (short-subunit alcohol dehydrogenase family) [Pedobacter sp. UYP30]|uniref:SDR family oxidoreductase n=1 Tax=Pedobacter sp. UYP30 TaxID=1756400 RepID=UPI0033996AF6